MITNIKLITLSSILLFVVFFCRKTNNERTALDHAFACQDVLGPLPNFSCADAVEVPIQTIFDGLFFFYKDLAR